MKGKEELTVRFSVPEISNDCNRGAMSRELFDYLRKD